MIFSGLRLGLIFALLGVVGAELIAAEHGLGQTLAYPSRPSDGRSDGPALLAGFTWAQRHHVDEPVGALPPRLAVVTRTST